MEPLFSVIIPTYNRAYVLWKAIQSVVQQTETRWEIIVVDDGSTDCTLRLLEEFHEPRLRVISTANQGPSAARNCGLALAQGPYIAYLDSDNTWHADFMETMYQAIQANSDAVLWYCGNTMTSWERTSSGEWFVIARGSYPARQYTAGEIWQLAGADTNRMVHRREVAAEVGGWDEQCRWIEDWDFFLRVFLRYPGQVVAVADVLVDYRHVYGTGADGICAEAREHKHAEVAARQYLLQKWRQHPDFAAAEKLSRQADDLPLIRAPR